MTDDGCRTKRRILRPSWSCSVVCCPPYPSSVVRSLRITTSDSRDSVSDSDCPRALCETFNRNFLHKLRRTRDVSTERPKRLRTRGDSRDHVCSSEASQMRRKPIFHGHFLHILENSFMQRRASACGRSRSSPHRVRARNMLCRNGRGTLHQAKMLVFLARCSNPNAVFAIPAGTNDIATHSRLGGQHGEEAKDEDEVSGEERGAQDEAPEEEVKYSPFPVFDFEQRR